MKQTDIIYTINDNYHIEIRERKCYNTFRLRLMNSNKERIDEICCPKERYGLSMQKLINKANELEMYYVMRNKITNELVIISHNNYDDCYMIDYNAIYASSYEECLEYCENIIGYKED